MRILLDESVPRALQNLLPDHQVSTAAAEGWASIANGELLTRAAAAFDILVTADQNMPHQQDLTRFDIGVVVLVAPTNSMVHYEPIAEKTRAGVDAAAKGEARWTTA
jgi:predicted nuclease of predicted toxin-antitoxin system